MGIEKKMTRIRRFAGVGVAAVAVVALAAACVADPDAAPAPPGKTKLRIATSLVDSIPYMTILQVAANKGWFSDAGLDVTITNSASGGDAVRLVTSGEADITMAGPDAVYKAATSPDSDMTIMGSWFEHNVAEWIAAKPGVQLQGAKLGVTGAGSTGEFLIKAINAAHPELNLQEVVIGGLGPNWDAAKAGQIDGAYAAEPQSQSLIAEGGTILLQPADIIGDLPVNLAAVRTSYATENPDAVKAFWTVADKAFTYIRNDTANAITDINAIIKMDAGLLGKSMDAMLKYDTSFTIKTDCAGFKNLATQWVATGATATAVDWSTVMDQQYLPEDARCDFKAA